MPYCNNQPLRPLSLPEWLALCIVCEKPAPGPAVTRLLSHDGSLGRIWPTSEVPRTRFERIAAGIRPGRGMDPVDLYRCGSRYYVLDGHHRIAVARALGERWVSANITDVRLNRLADPILSYRD
jgi:hypothetical protein